MAAFEVTTEACQLSVIAAWPTLRRILLFFLRVRLLDPTFLERRSPNMPSAVASGRSFSEIVQTLAQRFFEGLGQVAQYFDSLPLEEKHRIKTGLITLFSKGGSSGSWKYLLEDDKKLK